MRTDIPAEFLAKMGEKLYQWQKYAKYYKTRNFFLYADLVSDFSFPTFLDHYITDNVVPQDFKSGVTVCNESGVLWASEIGDPPAKLNVSGDVLATEHTRPSYWNGAYYFCKNDDIRKVVNGVSNSVLFQAGAECSVHAHSGTIGLVGYKKGCYWIAFADESGILAEMLYSLPEKSLVENAENMINANFSGMVVKDGIAFMYITSMRGEIISFQYDIARQIIRDPGVAVYADLCETRISNAYIDGLGNIRLCAQFLRVDDLGSFDSQTIMNFDMVSATGLSFSMSFDVAFASGNIDKEQQLGHRYQGCMIDDAPVYSCSGRYLVGEKTFFHSASPDGETISILSVSGSSDGVSLQVANNYSVWDDNLERAVQLFIHGQAEDLLIGTYIAYKSEDLENGILSISISSTSEAGYRLEQMSSPIYLERDGKQASIGDIEELGNLARRETNMLRIPVSADTYKKGSVFIFEHAQGTTEDVMTDQLNAPGKYSALPVISKLPLTAKIYGWSRPGKKSNDDGLYVAGRDTCHVSAKNDVISLLVKVRKASGLEQILSFSATGADYFTQTYPSARSGGAYPVAFSASTGLDIGDVVLSLGARCVCPITLIGGAAASGQWSTTYIERIDAENLYAPVYFGGVGDVSLGSVSYNSENSICRVLRAPGDPVIFTANTPYNAENFDVVVHGVVSGVNAWLGCVGLHDGTSYFAARKSIDRVEFVRVINGNLQVIDTEVNSLTEFKMLFQKRENLFRVYVVEPGEVSWGEPVITSEYDATTIPMTTTYGYLATGVLMQNDAPWARVTSKKKTKSDFLAAFQVSDFAEFPSSGTLSIGGKKFNYSGKVSADLIRGPYPVAQYYKHKIGEYSPPFISVGKYEKGGDVDAFDGYLFGDNFSGASLAIENTLYDLPIMLANELATARERIALQAGDVDTRIIPNQPCSKGWITLGFQGVVGVTDADQDAWIKCGEIAFLDTDTAIYLVGFYSSSGQRNLPIRQIIADIGELSGSKVTFSGDTQAQITLTEDWQ